MKALLDTSTFLWALSEPTRLSKETRARLEADDTEVFLSAASTWEISIKFGLGKLPLPNDPATYIPRQREAAGIALLPISEEATLQVHRLPPHHRDPFDRILISQALCEGMVLVTCDPMIAKYPVRTLW